MSTFISHVNSCEDPSPYDEPLSPELQSFAGLFRVRFHSALSAMGPPSATGKGWPTPDERMRDSTPSTRAIVVRDGPWYALRSDDADRLPRLGGAADAGSAHLYLGSEAAARSAEWLAARRVRAIVNCAHNSEALPAAALAAAGVAGGVARVSLVDAAGVDGQDSGALIEQGADAVAAALRHHAAAAGGAVLVHCVAGMSRSAAVAIAFLVKHDGASLRDAAAAVRRARPVAMPNVEFWRALCQLETRLHGGRSSVPLDAVDALHPRTDFPVSTHIFGDPARS